MKREGGSEQLLGKYYGVPNDRSRIYRRVREKYGENRNPRIFQIGGKVHPLNRTFEKSMIFLKLDFFYDLKK